MKKLLYILLFVPFTFLGQDDYSLSFDDVDDYVIIDNPIYSAEEFSLNCWVKFYQSGPNENGNLIGNWSMHPGGAYLLFYSTYQGNQTISAIVGGDEESVHLETPLQSGDFNTWNFISLTYDGTHSKLYINGNLRDSLYGEFGTIEGSNIATFGVEENYNFGQGINAHYGGLMDEISIWNKSLSNQEIQSYMSCPPTGHEESLVGYWKVNEISSNIIYDASVNENHGIIYGGATLSEDVPENTCIINTIYDSIPQFGEYDFIGEYGSSLYYISNFTSSWESANESSNNFGGHLVTISSQEENDFVMDAIFEHGLNPGGTNNYQAWIGLYQNINSADYSEPYGGWEWITGEPLNYTNWASQGSGNFVHITDNNCPLNIYGAQIPENECGVWDDAILSSNLTSAFHVMEFEYGCTDVSAYNYNSISIVDDGSCLTYEEYTIDSLNNVVEQATISLSSLQQALDTWNTTIDLSSGWNMFGYGCPSSIDVAAGLSNHTESIIITKDNNGAVYMPEFGFNGIGDFTPGYGYQIKLTEAIEGFSLCDWYVNDIPEDNIVSLQDYIIQLEDSIELLNALPTYEVGDYAEGGIVFYVDEAGQHGLVVSDIIAYISHSDINEHVNNFNSNGVYQDWYFPSIEELESINQSVGLSQLPTWYWSSSYFGNDGNCDLYWGIGGDTDTNCDNTNGHIVVIRSF